jgi:hypothetical protein
MTAGGLLQFLTPTGGMKNEQAVALSGSAATLKSGMKPWKTHMVESNGDYRLETYLEEHIGGPLYALQKEIPRLPIPDIEDTMGRFLPTALPLVKSAEEKVALKEACEAFPEQAKILQQRLVARRDGEFADSSWLQQWWNQVSIPIFTSFEISHFTFSFPLQ